MEGRNPTGDVPWRSGAGAGVAPQGLVDHSGRYPKASCSQAVGTRVVSVAPNPVRRTRSGCRVVGWNGGGGAR